MKKRKNSFKTLTVVCLVLAVAFTVLLYIVCTYENQTDENTSLYVATVISTKSKGNANNTADFTIYTKEYSNTFWIPEELCRRLDADKLLAIKQGDRISVRIGKPEAEPLLNKAEFVSIVSLESNGTEILSLNDYNRMMHETSKPTKIACVAAVTFFAGLAFAFYKCSQKTNKPTSR